MKNIVLLSVLIFSAISCLAQAPEVTVKGHVIDRSGKGVKARIRYSSIPSGGINGRFNDSTFSFSIFGTADYQVTAEAEGFNPKTIILTPADIDANKKIIRTIQLTPKGETIVLEDLIFAQGKSAIDPKSYPGLDEVAQMMKENSKIEIQLEGHTDNQGSPKANLALSQDRVDAVKKYLVEKGVSKSRIQTKAFGGTQPLGNELTPEARVKNRRVEMRILKQ
jgi:outer membrane protein OmpA-like peptidoglycan-associated protein